MEPYDYDAMLQQLMQLSLQYGTLLDRLTAIQERQELCLSQQELRLSQHDAQMARLADIQGHQEITLARVEALLARMLSGGGNGRDA
jgi:hypothetical protein